MCEWGSDWWSPDLARRAREAEGPRCQAGVVRRDDRRGGLSRLQRRDEGGSGGGTAGEHRGTVQEDATVERRVRVLVVEIYDLLIHALPPSLLSWPDRRDGT